MSRECEHVAIFATDGGWKCKDCPVEFIPMLAAVGMAEARADDIVAVASAMMWDFHQRAVEEYGPDIAKAVAPVESGIPVSLDYQPEDCPEHEFIANRCIRCGISKFF